MDFLSVAIPPTCVYPLGYCRLPPVSIYKLIIFHVFFQWTDTVLLCLLLFTVHRTSIWVFLPHTFINDYFGWFSFLSLLLPFHWTPFILFLNVLFPSPSLSLLHCKADILHACEDPDSVFSRHHMTVFSGFLREGWDANVSTLYNDRQLCIYCLFIVDLYIKEMSILYIISIHTEILWSCFWSWYWKTILTVGPFVGCTWRHRWLSLVTCW